MSSCLGLYIDSKIIKYAKITKEKSGTRIDSFGVKTYENLQSAIDQIVSETSSYKTPISVNINNEEYRQIKVFNLLSAKDVANVVQTEFENSCEERNQNKNAFDYRYILADDFENKEKVRVISAIANRADIAKKMTQLEGKKIIALAPLGVTVANLLKAKNKENCLIVNIEENTTVTTVVNQKIYDIETMDIGMKEVLENINHKENSYSKAYEICKNTTIYTNENKDLQQEENQYIDEIMPALYEIVGKVRKMTNESLNRIDKIYITGTAAVINNIDIYFQEYLTDIECEILKPYFARQNSGKINIKDYIEVNSAISLSLFGLGEGDEAVNFKKVTWAEKVKETLNLEIGGSKQKEGGESEPKELDSIETNLLKISGALLMVLVVYIIFSVTLNYMIAEKENETSIATGLMQTEIDKVTSDKDKIKNSADQYKAMIDSITQIQETATENERYKNKIPTLLSEIMFVIPKNVQLTSIENTSGTHIIIKAQAEKYEQLGYLKGRLKTDNILTDVISDSGQKQDGVIVVTIEGEMP